MIRGGGYVPAPKRKYLFVDAACLEFTMRRFGEYFFDNKDVPVNHQGLQSGSLGEPFDKVFYYDALPIQEDGELDAAWQLRTAERRSVLEKIEGLDRFHVFEGDVRQKGGGRKHSRGQKKVDVGVAVDMLTNAFRKNMDEAALIAGDIDFVPLLAALALEGMPVTLWHPENATAELKRAALIRRPLSPETLWRLTTPDFIAKHPLPFVFGPNQFIQNPNFVTDWREPNGERIGLFETDSLFGVRSVDAESKWEVRTWPRRALVRYCRDVLKLKIPERLIE